MAFDVRPVEDLDEFTRAVLAIGQYFGMAPNEERMQRFTRPAHRSSGCTARGRTATIVGGAGAFPFKPDGAGRRAADRRRHRRRRVARRTDGAASCAR